ncbi:uncharacterized protein HD556DRAFT_1303841 [Suillus plorans]|uniref:Fungal-type protein kinase domain-containing protein n=1 Tax=Suillus plorans TaxID=116603 RepID=A0A9P7J5H7_9AGAM|nr:uncharacterized protein HD556DRAFT_1303841 [Suillus plorans]KAG1803843.1 hypothetical protein HD556DRAFT_1303841 [Suillus plorans]
MTLDPTIPNETPTVDAVIPVQPVVQDSQLAPTTPTQRNSSVDDGTIIPAAELVLSQSALQDLQSAIIDTPIKWDSSTLLPFTTLALKTGEKVPSLSRCRVDTLNAMGKEMQDHVVGLMSVENFLDEFLPNPDNHDPSDFTTHFTSAYNTGVFDMQSVTKEENSYDRFMSEPAPINAIRPFAPQLSFVNTSRHSDTQNCLLFTFNIKPDVCVYADGTSRSCNISKFKLNIEFKWNDAHDTFSKHSGIDKPIVSQTDKGFDTLAWCSILHSRILRWDREGVIITGSFDYNDKPYLADFFYCYARASPEMHGVNISVTPASAKDADLARTVLGLPTTTRMFKVAVPEDPDIEDSSQLTLIIPQPVARGFPPVGHWTRTCPAFDILNKKIMMFKDSWRMSIKDVLPEGETCKLLMSHKVHNIARCIAFHNVIHPIPQQNTQTVKSGSAEWACPNKAVTPHTLHRLALDIVGEKLNDFQSSKQLVQSIPHQDVYENAKILHQDLSVGNIIIYRGQGFLIDCDLAKLLTIQGPQQTTRTGTWQFMSAHLVKHSRAIHTVEDDLKSSLYIILWTAQMFKESYMSIIDQTQFITQVLDADPLVGSGGCAKSSWLVARTYFPQDIFVDCKPLDSVILELAQFFSHRYSILPPEEQEELAQLWITFKHLFTEEPVQMAGHQKMIDFMQNIMSKLPAYKKEVGMRVLHSHDSVIKIYNKYLEAPGWPVQDAAVLQKLHLSDKKTGHCMYTKSLCLLQDVTPVQ